MEISRAECVKKILGEVLDRQNHHRIFGRFRRKYELHVKH